MGVRWYRFSDASRSKIVGSSESKQPDDPNKPQEQLPDDDPRVREFIGPEWARAKYQEFDVEVVEDLVRVVHALGSFVPAFAFRGQADFDWPLESRLEREQAVFVREYVGLEIFERRILREAKRRALHHFSERPDATDALGWLAFLRHHAIPTRLLDLSWSPYIAMHFGLPPFGKQADAALWAFGPFCLGLALHSQLARNPEPFREPVAHAFFDGYRGPTVSFATKDQPLQGDEVSHGDLFGPHRDRLLVELALQGRLGVRGVVIVDPEWITPRQDAQQGAFLLPFDVRSSLEANLLEMLDVDQLRCSERRRVPTETELLSIIGQNVAVLKLRIPWQLHDELRHMLRLMNIRDLVLFPDFRGVVGFLEELVPRRRE